VKLSPTVASALFTSLDTDGPIKGAFLLRRTGVSIASWTQPGIPSEILSVMSATLIGSVDTIAGALAFATPQTVSVETNEFRLLATHAEGQTLLVLIAPRSASDSYLRHVSRQVLTKLAAETSRTETRRTPVGSRL
jgi:predicted regulator of Ras-like GTPase activity (Roadblock/LC7/MglB family)